MWWTQICRKYFINNNNLFFQRTVKAPNDWSGRFWARTYCDVNTKHCLTGDCGNRIQCGGNGEAPPASLVEITLNGWENLDYYDISLVDGFNLAVSVSMTSDLK